MGKELAEAFPAARQVFEQANSLLGINLMQTTWDGPESELNDTINTQPALLVTSVAVLAVIDELYPHLQPVFVAGHSMGELSALVAAQALDYPAALKLARRRGELMKEAGEINPGAMAAVLGMDIPTLDKVCMEASTAEEIVQVANDNCPGQVVISGHSQALARAIQLAQQAGARKIRPLVVSIAAHSPLMLQAQEAFNLAVNAAEISDPAIPLIGNVSARPLPSAGQIRSDLQAQLTSRVRWTESIQFMVDQGIDLFLELGSGSVLTGLLKRINEQVKGIALGTPADFDKLDQNLFAV
jgi:[acyl-carrier-protein] S-malonyltransferase